jgi:hypothetical protein
MKRTTALLVLLLGVAGIAAPAITPTPWRYGVFYWVGEVPEHPEAYVNMATNWVDRVFAFWGLTPLPGPTVDWRNPQEISANSQEEARLVLSPDFSPAGVVVPGPEAGTFWAVPSLLLRELEINPLTLVVFPAIGELQTSLCAFNWAGAFFRHPPSSERLALLDSPVAAVLREIGGPAILLPVIGRPPMTSQDYFMSILAHEIGHWATLVWAEGHGLDMAGMTGLLIEGLAEYTEFTLSFGEPDRHRAAPVSLHPVAAVWAQRGGGLADAPNELIHAVGLSLVDFLVRKHYLFGNVLRLLPSFLEDWNARLAEWEGEWREWLRGEVPPWAPVRTRLLVEKVFYVASLVEPLFPNAWDVVRGTTAEEDVAWFWASISGPPPTPTPDALQKLRERECVFRLAAQREGVPPEVREQAQEILARLDQHWEAGDWDAYAATYLEAVLTQLKPAQSPEGIP